MNIVEFLKSRISEDEAAANSATGARWVVLSGVNASLVNIDPTNVRDEKLKYGRFGHIATTSHDAAYAEHIARHDPARVLAECAAKRAIIREHAEFVEAIERLSAALPGNLNQDPDAYWRTSPLRHLASVYKEHADYRPEWALDTP